MTPEEYKKVAWLCKHITPFYRPDSPVNAENPSYNEYVGKAVKTIRDEIHDTRAMGRIGSINSKTPSRIMKKGKVLFHAPTLQKIKKHINDRLGGGRTDIEVDVGKEVSAEKVSKKDREDRWARGPIIRITVGHMWERKVYNEFYRDGNLHSDWFILSANEVRVNKKHQFRIFEAMLFRPDLNEIREGYVVKATIGKKVAEIAFTAASAVEKGLAILDQAVRERVIQKEDTNDQ